MKTITVTTAGGFEVLMDNKDYLRAKKYRWSVQKIGRTHYVRVWIGSKGINLHRFILDPPKERFIDHINGNGLDNRRANLRYASITENNWNARKTERPATSKYIGVSYIKKTKRWQATIAVNSKNINIGQFDLEIVAVIQRDLHVIKYRDEHAKTNFPRELYEYFGGGDFNALLR